MASLHTVQKGEDPKFPHHEVLTLANDKPPTMIGSDSDPGRGTFVPKRCTSPSQLKAIPNILELQSWATENALAPSLGAFVNYGAEDDHSLLANREGFSKYSLRPRVLKDVSQVQTTTTILQGRVKLAFPVCIAPFAGCRAIHPDGEPAIAKAAAKAGIVYTIPNWASTPLPKIIEHLDDSIIASAKNAPPFFFQIYPHKPTHPNEGFHREHMKALLEYVARTGRIVAVVVTCDTVNNGNREKTYLSPQWASDLSQQVGGFPTPCALQDANLPNVTEQGHTARMTIDDIRWMVLECEKHGLALILKGIMTHEDASLAAKAGVDAIIVSNHGGRQLDGTLGTVQVVEECVQAVAQTKSKMEVYVDGGIRRGKDVVKCLALGAKCVFVGRPILWGLAVSGQDGVTRALEILQGEFRTVLQLIGANSPQELSRDHVTQEGDPCRQPNTGTGSQWLFATGVVAVAAFALGRYSCPTNRVN